MPLPTLSIIIASHRPTYIQSLLSALSSQAPGGPSLETIVVADYAPDALKASHPEARFLYVKDRSISAKRNAGAREARAPTLAFIDDDCVPAPDWTAAGAAFLASHPEFAGVEGLTTIENSAYSPPSLREYRRLERPGFRTNNIFYRKAAFLDAGGFDERFTVQREDIDLAFTIMERGLLIGHDTAIRVMHRVRTGEPWDLLKNCWNRRFDPLLHKKHPDRYREHIGSPFPRTLLLLLLLHCGVLGALAIAVPIGIAALGIDLAAVTVFTLRRSAGHGSLCTEWIACMVAPIVLLGALVHGSVRHQTFLLV